METPREVVEAILFGGRLARVIWVAASRVQAARGVEDPGIDTPLVRPGRGEQPEGEDRVERHHPQRGPAHLPGQSPISHRVPEGRWIGPTPPFPPTPPTRRAGPPPVR